MFKNYFKNYWKKPLNRIDLLIDVILSMIISMITSTIYIMYLLKGNTIKKWCKEKWNKMKKMKKKHYVTIDINFR